MFTNILHKSPGGVRHEYKFALPSEAYEILRNRMRAVLKTDENADESGGYRVTSLYFDDVYGTAYKDKLGGFLQRKKFRVRAYNLSPERISLECKFKGGEFIKKKSALLTPEEYHALVRGDYNFCLDRQESEVLKDFYFTSRTAGLKPAAITDYYREAFTAEAGNVRITFDSNVSAGLGTFDMFEARYTPVKSEIVLEIKYDRFIPSYILELFSGFPLIAEPISKYILCANQALEVNKACY